MPMAGKSYTRVLSLQYTQFNVNYKLLITIEIDAEWKYVSK